MTGSPVQRCALRRGELDADAGALSPRSLCQMRS